VPYLTNDERIRLGLQRFGSDVPAHEIAAAEQEYRERQRTEKPEPEHVPVKRKRASKGEAQ
jgi:hypothetical protein